MMNFKDGGRTKLGEHSRAKMIKQGDKTIAHTGHHGVEAPWLSGRGFLDQPRKRLSPE